MGGGRPVNLFFRDVEVRGERTDVRVRDGRVVEMGTLRVDVDDDVVTGRGGALLPGLHDHHLHLLSLAAVRSSVDCSTGLHDLAGAVPHRGWVRGIGLSTEANRVVLDDVRRDVPVRVQHRSGSLWVLNSAALAAVEHVLDTSEDVERDPMGRPTGRLWRYDTRLRPALPAGPPHLEPVVTELRTHGITGVTDATPDLDATTVDLLTALSGLRVTLLGASSGTKKLMLRDHDLPTYNALCETIAAAHASGRPVAVHCVTRESLILTLVVLSEVGSLLGDRIEHGAVVPPEVILQIAQLGLAVVTNPGFLEVRGDDYLRDVDPDDRSCLYPYASLQAAGIAVAPASDAPFGPLDPWAVIRSATARATPSGIVVTPYERVPAATALDGYLSDPRTPGGPARKVAPGVTADLCLLRVPLREALAQPDAALVRQTYVAGEAPP